MGDNMKKNEQKIKCDVFECRHCICDECICNLDEIKVSNCNNNKDKESTMCDSFKKRKI